MKGFISFALLIAGISALPQQFNAELKNERFVTDTIASALEDLSQSIKDAGLDPLYVKVDQGSYALPVPIILDVNGILEEFLVSGLSDIVINKLNYSVLSNTLQFDISLPLIEATLGKAEIDATLFGEEYKVSAGGRLTIKEINVAGEARPSIGIISGISVSRLNLNFNLEAIESHLAVTLLGYDLSNDLNTFFGTSLTNTLNTFSDEVDELLEIVVLDIINANL